MLADASAFGTEPSSSAQLGVMVAEGRVALRSGALDDAIAVLQAALDMSERTECREYELEINDLLATAFKRSGRFEEALERRERHDAQYRKMFTHAADLRLRTLQVAHDTATARQQAEIFRLRTQELEVMVASDDGAAGSATAASHHHEAFEHLAILTEFRDAETGEHTNRVGDLAAEIAHALGHSPEWCEQLRLAARLHDVGKVAVPDSVLRKTGPLTVEEYEMMKSHTSMGHRILAGNSSPMFQMAAEIAQSHHEWWDGSGYPLGIANTSIARRRPDRQRRRRVRRTVQQASRTSAAWSRVESARFVISGRGGQFDPDIVDAFVAVIIARYPELGRALKKSPSAACYPSARPTQSARTGRARRSGPIRPAPGVAVARHGAEHAECQQGRVGVGNLPGRLGGSARGGDVVEVHAAAGPQASANAGSERSTSTSAK